MKIQDLLRKDVMLLDLQATEKTAVIEEMIKSLVDHGYVTDFETFKEEFNKKGAGQFGSGWVWLVSDKEGNIDVVATPNQDCPISCGKVILLGNDVWEHAYYLKYQNRRAEYLKEWWKVVNWDVVEARYQKRNPESCGCGCGCGC